MTGQSDLRGGDDVRRCTPCQLKAIAHVQERARRAREDARVRLATILSRAQRVEDDLLEALRGLQRGAKVVLHFHPDRITNNGQTVARRLLADGLYRSQFETGISNGSPTAYPGGERDIWERELFGGAYHSSEVRVDERPKYGSMQLFQYGDGPSPRFGSCYFVLHRAASLRSTFTYGDSHTRPDTVGTLSEPDSIVGALLEDVDDDGAALGRDGLTVAGMLDYLAGRNVPHLGRFGRSVDPVRCPVGRVLDDYIEAQVHGPIKLDVDVESLVADPSFRGTDTGRHLVRLCHRYGIVLRWHRGFVLHVDSVPADFRGPTMITLARRIADVAGSKVLDASVIGVAAASLHHNRERWSEWGSPTEVLRRFRQIWHVLVRFGEARDLHGS